jgi:hypothetical protein
LNTPEDDPIKRAETCSGITTHAHKKTNVGTVVFNYFIVKVVV